MIEVRVTAEDAGGFKWVGHGVANTEALAIAKAEERLPEGFTTTDTEVTRADVDADLIHPDWVDDTPA